MDNQVNNMFSNVLEPSGIPDVKDENNNFGPTNQVNEMTNALLNQNVLVSNNISSDISQNSFIDNNLVQESASNTLNNGTISNENGSQDNQISSGDIVAGLESANNFMPQQGAGNNIEPLSFVMPNEVNNGTNFNNNLNVNSVMNTDVIQEPVETNNMNISSNMMNFEIPSTNQMGMDSSLSSRINSGDSLDLDKNFLDDQSNKVSSNVSLDSNNVSNNTEVENKSFEEVKKEDSGNISNTISDEGYVVSIQEYLGYIFLFSIPVVGIILLFIKAFNKKSKNIGNLAKAMLLLNGIILVISLILFTFFSTVMVEIATTLARAVLGIY